jgi:hypothetical protein
MTRLLDKAFDEASRLPEMEQNALTKWLLHELHSGKSWQMLSLIRNISWRNSPMRPLQRDEKARLLRSIRIAYEVNYDPSILEVL